MNRSIPNVIQSPLKFQDNLVIHALHHSKTLGHDLSGFTKSRNFFLRNSLVADHNGKVKLGGEEDASLRKCVNFGPGKGGRIAL